MKVVKNGPGDVLGVALGDGKMYLGCYRWSALGGVIFYLLRILSVSFGMDWV